MEEFLGHWPRPQCSHTQSERALCPKRVDCQIAPSEILRGFAPLQGGIAILSQLRLRSKGLAQIGGHTSSPPGPPPPQAPLPSPNARVPFALHLHMIKDIITYSKRGKAQPKLGLERAGGAAGRLDRAGHFRVEPDRLDLRPTRCRRRASPSPLPAAGGCAPARMTFQARPKRSSAVRRGHIRHR
jgi:hypothetical protein